MAAKCPRHAADPVPGTTSDIHTITRTRGNDLMPMRIEKIVGIEARKFRARRHPPSAIGPPSFLKVLRRERLFSTGVLVPTLGGEAKSMASTEDTLLIRQAMAYVIELYREMTEENGAPMLGTQNQVVDYILAEPELGLGPLRSTRQRPRRRFACRTTTPIGVSVPVCNPLWNHQYSFARASRPADRRLFSNASNYIRQTMFDANSPQRR